MIDRAIILAGGLGTRLRPLTDKIPKPLLPIKNKPIVEHIIENLKKYGVNKITLCLGYKAEQVKDYFKDGSELGINLEYSIETEPLGTGGAIRKAAEKINKPFFLLWGDNLMDLDLATMYKDYLRDAPQVTMALVPREDLENFGVAVLDGSKIINFIEKPKRQEAPSKLINAGAFIVEPECLKILPEGKSSMEKDCFEKLALLGEISAHFHKSQWYPTDTLKKYLLADREFKPLSNISKKQQ